MSSERTPDRTGQRVGSSHRLDQRIGEGAFSSVYRATHLETGQSVAAKLLELPWNQIPECTSRFRREYEILQGLQHPAIVAAYEAGEETDGRLYMILELMEGTSLANHLRDAGALPPMTAVAIMSRVLEGLRHAHAANVVHRDLTPANILVSTPVRPSSQVKLVDFGIATRPYPVTLVLSSRLTLPGIPLGTPAYIAPEQAIGDSVDRRTDLYSAAVVLFEMLTGQLPFSADDRLELLALHRFRPAPSLRSRGGGEKLEAFEEVVRRGLAKVPGERFQDAKTFLDRLTRAARSLPTTS